MNTKTTSVFKDHEVAEIWHYLRHIWRAIKLLLDTVNHWFLISMVTELYLKYVFFIMGICVIELWKLMLF